MHLNPTGGMDKLTQIWDIMGSNGIELPCKERIAAVVL